MIDYDDRDDGQQEAWATEYEEWCREQENDDAINEMAEDANRE